MANNPTEVDLPNNENNVSISKMLEAPLGPFSAVDLTIDGQLLCFDEKKDQIISINIKTGQWTSFSVPEGLCFQYFYWSNLISLSRDILLVLLKEHKTRIYYLVTMKLNFEKPMASIISKFKTTIKLTGYWVSVQKKNNELYFGFCGKKLFEKRKRKEVSDMEIFLKQFAARSGYSSKPVTSKRILKNNEIEEIFEKLEKSYEIEAVILQVNCDDPGKIKSNILSLGRAQCFSVSDAFLPEMDSINALLHFATTLPTKTKITSLSVCNPFYANGFLYFIDRMNPKQAFVFKTFPDPERGLIASFQTRIARSGIFTKCLVKQATIDCSSGMPFVGDEVVWSNVQTFNNNAFFLIQDLKINTCVLWRIQLDSTITEENSKDYEVNEIHIDKGEPNDKRRHCTIIHISDSDTVSYSKYPHKNKNTSKSEFSNSLKWQKIQEFNVSMFKLFDNSALHFDTKENYAFVKGIKTDYNGKSIGHCFIAFLVQYKFENEIPSIA